MRGGRASGVDRGSVVVLVLRSGVARSRARRPGPRDPGRPLARGPSPRDGRPSACDRPRRADVDAESGPRSVDRLDVLARQSRRLSRAHGCAPEDRNHSPRVSNSGRSRARVRSSLRPLRSSDPAHGVPRGREGVPAGSGDTDRGRAAIRVLPLRPPLAALDRLPDARAGLGSAGSGPGGVEGSHPPASAARAPALPAGPGGRPGGCERGPRGGRDRIRDDPDPDGGSLSVPREAPRPAPPTDRAAPRDRDRRPDPSRSAPIRSRVPVPGSADPAPPARPRRPVLVPQRRHRRVPRRIPALSGRRRRGPAGS